MKNSGKFVFDLDGTLIDNRGRLFDGVAEFFYYAIITYKEPKFMICTGNSVEKARQTIVKINKELAKNYHYKSGIKFYISAFSGTVIYDENGNIIKNNTINNDRFLQIETTVKDITNNSYIFLCCKDGIYYLPPKTFSKQNLQAQILKLAQKINPSCDYNIEPIKSEEYYKLVNLGKVHSLKVLSLDKQKKKEIFKTLNGGFYGLSVNDGFVIEVSAGSKLSAINSIFGYDLCDVVYMGNDFNDIEPMQACGKSFAFGNNEEVKKSATYALNQFAEVNEIIFNKQSTKGRNKQNKKLCDAEK
ncbi:MAG: HAD hydrolase family protein [Clostridia bacterium]|nr:HAD hydrolase family protein [Clostridia bacterium]